MEIIERPLSPNYSDEGEYLYAFSTGAIITDAVKPTGLAISIDKTYERHYIDRAYLRNDISLWC